MTKTHLPILFLELNLNADQSCNSEDIEDLAQLSWCSVDSTTVYAYSAVTHDDGTICTAATFRKFFEVVSSVFLHDQEHCTCIHIHNFNNMTDGYKISPSLFLSLDRIANNPPTERITALIPQCTTTQL